MCRGTQQMALPCAASQARPEGEEARRAQVGLAGLPQRDKMSRVGHSLVFTTASRRSTDRLLAPARLPRDNLEVFISQKRTSNAPGRIRTCDLRFRKPMLYPLSYRGLGLASLAALVDRRPAAFLSRKPRSLASVPAPNQGCLSFRSELVA